MANSSDLKKELIEIQSLAREKIQDNFYQRLVVTTITLLSIVILLVIVVSFLLKFVFGKDTIIGDFLLNLGIDFIGSTILFVIFSVVLKSSDHSKQSFKKIIFGFLGIGFLAFIFAFINNRGGYLIFYPQRSDFHIQSRMSYINYDVLLADASNECDAAVYDVVRKSIGSESILNNLDEAGLINRRYEIYSGQEAVNALLLNISAQFIGALIIYIGIEQLFQLFEKQQEAQKIMLKRIEQLVMKVK